jgi:hypothetical protein
MVPGVLAASYDCRAGQRSCGRRDLEFKGLVFAPDADLHRIEMAVEGRAVAREDRLCSH